MSLRDWILNVVRAVGRGIGIRLSRPSGTYIPPTPTAPAFTSNSIGGTPQDGQQLTAFRTVTGYPSPAITYQWQKNGTNIAGQTAQTITLNASVMALTPGDTISVEITATNGSGTVTVEPTIVFQATPDSVAPTLSSPTGAKNGSTAMTGTVSTDEANGTLYRYISTSGTPPSATNLKSGTGAVAFGSQTVSTTGVQNVASSGLAASTTYYVHYLHRDTAGNDSAIVSSASFITDAAAATPDTPVQSNRTGYVTGENPPRPDVQYAGIYYNNDSSDPAFGEGDKLRVRWKRLSGDAWTTEAWVPLDLNLVLPWDEGGGFRYAYLTDGTIFAAGRYEQQVQAVRDQGLGTEALGAWSASWIDTLNAGAEAATGFATVVGQDKANDAIVEGAGNRTTRLGYNDSNAHSVRALNNRSGKRQFQQKIDVFSGVGWIGVDNGTDNFNTDRSIPGRDNTTGIALAYFGTGFEIHRNGTGTPVQTDYAGSFMANDIITVAFDTTAGTLSFYRTRSGTTVQLGTTLTGLGFSSYYPNVGCQSTNTLTATFATGQARALDSGYVPFDN